MNPTYSEREIQLFKELKLDDILHQEPPLLYDQAIVICFMLNKNDNISDSVRRCNRALIEGYPKRLIKEFNDLIEL